MRTLCVTKAQVPAWECLVASAYGVLSLPPLWICFEIPVPIGIVPSVGVVAAVSGRNADIESRVDVVNALIYQLVNLFFRSGFRWAHPRSRGLIFVVLVEAEIHGA